MTKMNIVPDEELMKDLRRIKDKSHICLIF